MLNFIFLLASFCLNGRVKLAPHGLTRKICMFACLNDWFSGVLIEETENI